MDGLYAEYYRYYEEKNLKLCEVIEKYMRKYGHIQQKKLIIQSFENNLKYSYSSFDECVNNNGLSLVIYAGLLECLMDENPFVIEFILENASDQKELMKLIYRDRNYRMFKFVIKKYAFYNTNELMKKLSRKWKIYVSRILSNTKIPSYTWNTHHRYILWFLKTYADANELSSPITEFFKSPIFDTNLIPLIFKFVF